MQGHWKKLKEKADKIWRETFSESANTITVGSATCGISAGADKVFEAAQEEISSLNINPNLIKTGCMGHCYAEPLAICWKAGFPPILYTNLTPEKMKLLVKRLYTEQDPALEWAMGAMEENDLIPAVYEDPRFKKEKKRILQRCGFIAPDNIFHAIAMGCYQGFVNSLSIEPEDIIEEIRKAGLRGLGGAGFPTWKKWKMCRETPSVPRYIICNGDEGDPGAFMDRTVFESDPHSIIEGMLIGARAIGAQQGFVYVRREYPNAVKMIKKAVQNAENVGLLGQNILSSGMNFKIDVMEGAGAFVCGESTALISSIEGKRGMPRPRPPRSAQKGLWGKPTVLNNVKTFASCGMIMKNSASWFSEIGTEKSKGTAVFALAGKIKKAGLIEVEMGTTLREIVFDMGGGITPRVKTSDITGQLPPSSRRKFKAVQIGGPSGGWIPDKLLDERVDFDSLKKMDQIMGSGGMVVIDEDNCIVGATKFFLEFTQKESCGKCTFCRIGTYHMLRIVEKIQTGKAQMQELELLEKLAHQVKAGSLCNLGKTAPNPIISSLKYFKDEYIAHIKDKKCPALECQELISYKILLERCRRSCDACIGSCPVEAIFTRQDGLKQIDQEKCIKCESCYDACPSHYDAVVKVSPKITDK